MKQEEKTTRDFHELLKNARELENEKHLRLHKQYLESPDSLTADELYELYLYIRDKTLINEKSRHDDNTEKIRILHLSANMGNPEAQVYLGDIYQKGLPSYVERDIDTANHWFMLAKDYFTENAITNDSSAYSLAILYMYGKGGEMNFKKANEYFILSKHFAEIGVGKELMQANKILIKINDYKEKFNNKSVPLFIVFDKDYLNLFEYIKDILIDSTKYSPKSMKCCNFQQRVQTKLYEEKILKADLLLYYRYYGGVHADTVSYCQELTKIHQIPVVGLIPPSQRNGNLEACETILASSLLEECHML